MSATKWIVAALLVPTVMSFSVCKADTVVSRSDFDLGKIIVIGNYHFRIPFLMHNTMNCAGSVENISFRRSINDIGPYNGKYDLCVSICLGANNIFYPNRNAKSSCLRLIWEYNLASRPIYYTVVDRRLSVGIHNVQAVRPVVNAYTGSAVYVDCWSFPKVRYIYQELETNTFPVFAPSESRNRFTLNTKPWSLIDMGDFGGNAICLTRFRDRCPGRFGSINSSAGCRLRFFKGSFYEVDANRSRNQSRQSDKSGPKRPTVHADLCGGVLFGALIFAAGLYYLLYAFRHGGGAIKDNTAILYILLGLLGLLLGSSIGVSAIIGIP